MYLSHGNSQSELAIRNNEKESPPTVGEEHAA